LVALQFFAEDLTSLYASGLQGNTFIPHWNDYGDDPDSDAD